MVAHVRAGPVPEIAAAVRDEVTGRPLVAFGGGRVVDAAKAIGGADGLAVAAIPTTLAGSSMTAIHRMPAGVDEWRLIRPALVIADPEQMASLPRPDLVATAMNALAHAMEALYGPLANPIAELAGLRAAELFGAALGADPPPPAEVSLAALLGGYAVGSAGLSFHHALCQTIVRTTGSPHARTNAVVLPHSGALAAERSPRVMDEFEAALGATSLADLCALTGTRRLRDLGVDPASRDAILAALAEHPALAAPGAPSQGELAAVLDAAL